MAYKHYYIEDLEYRGADKKPHEIPSIQFNESIKKEEVFASVQSGTKNKNGDIHRIIVRIPLEELKNTYDWFKE